MINMDIDSDIT